MSASTAVTLDCEELARVNELIPKGNRYPKQHMPDLRGNR